jgi:hypothetical protein
MPMGVYCTTDTSTRKIKSMRRGTIFIILLIILGVVTFGALQLLRSQPPLEIAVAVHPLAEDWVRSAADAFNATNPSVNARRIQITVTAIDDLVVWGTSGRPWSAQNHPAMWIPASSSSITYASESGLPFQMVEPSVAKTVLVWGAFTSRYNALTDEGAASLDWTQIAEGAAQIRWTDIAPTSSIGGSITLAFNNPERTMSGLAAVFSAAADFGGAAALTAAQVGQTDFRSWFQPVLESVPNFNTLGASPAETLASRGTSVGDAALLPESEWLTNLRGTLIGSDAVQLSYPAFNFVFDFPLASWIDTTAPPETNGAVTQFAAWLLSPTQQTAAQSFALRPVNGTPTGERFMAAERYGALLDPDLANAVIAPPRTATQSLLAWVGTLVQ